MPYTRQHTFANKTVIAGADLDDEFDALRDMFAAALATGDLSAAAGILLTQLEASKEHIDVALTVDGTGVGGGGWPASGPLTAVPVPEVSGTDWTVTHVYWICNDTGLGTGTFRVDWGEYDALGAWSQVQSVATGTLSNADANNDGNDGVATLGTVALEQDTTVRSLGLIGVGAQADTISAATGFVCVVVRIRRDISSS
jgi:hypothetical protein